MDIIYSTENEAIKEGTVSVNANYKSSHVTSNFVAICIILIIRSSRCSLKLLCILRKNNLSTSNFSNVF